MTEMLWKAIDRGDAEGVQQAIRNGADVNFVGERNDCPTTPLSWACYIRFTEIVLILLDAGANARWKDSCGRSPIDRACSKGHLTIVEMLINHDKDLLEIKDNCKRTPLYCAIFSGQEDVIRFLLDCGANVFATDRFCNTTLMHACKIGSNLDIMRLLLAAGVDAQATDTCQRTALHFAALNRRVEAVRELILHHNAISNMLARDKFGKTPFDVASLCPTTSTTLIEIYVNKLTANHGRLAFHELLSTAEYSFAENPSFHPPLNSLQICLPLGKLTLKHWRTLLQSLDSEFIRTRNNSGKLPIHLACQTDAPVEVLSTLVELDSDTLHIADYTGALPIHSLCCNGVVDYSRVRYLLEQGGVGTLTTRNHQGALPLHMLCGSTNPSLRTVRYVMQSFPRSIAAQTNDGRYPFMMAAASDPYSASLSVVFMLVRANPGLVVPR